MNVLSNLPSVEHLLQTADISHLLQKHGRQLTLDAIRLSLDEYRLELRGSPAGAVPSTKEILSRTESHIMQWESDTLVPVINATGVILHTNLGRAPLSSAALRAMSLASSGYSNLEFDLVAGKRGERFLHVERLLQKLLGVEAALVVNNNASAVLLVLAALAARRKVAIARSQLVEIGGGFRVPEVMKQSGAKLLEVGTTNKVRLADYEEAMGAGASLLMHVHRSNFKIVGFTEEPALAEIAEQAHAAGLFLVDDLGSGALLDTAHFGLTHEPTVQESIAARADIVCFSGDKLFGGPQAGIIAGREELLRKVKKHPLARALRADKACLAGTSATLLHYLRGEAETEIPVWRMIGMPLDAVRSRAKQWAEALGVGEVRESESTVGGGSLPGESLNTHVLSLSPMSADGLLRGLREQVPPIIARTEAGQVLLDPRTVLEEQDSQLVQGLRAVLTR